MAKQIDIGDKSLLGAVSKYGNPYRTYDDGFGPLWVYRESLGVLGIVRAQTWDDAWECVVDEIMDDADPADMPTDADADLPEGYHYRPNGGNKGDASMPWCQTAIAQEDLNGSALEPLTDAQLDDWGIVLRLED